MNWIQLKITTTGEGIDPICGVLYDMDITGIEISDKDDFKEFLENNRKYWDYVDEELERLKTADSCITVYLSDDAEGKAQLEKVKTAVSALNIPNTMFHTENMKDEDWSENWKQYFKPLEIGKKVLIVPEWEENVPETDRVKFVINPGVSFGTGSHESTKMCIEEIEKALSTGDSVLDLGCGSGILSVIALLLGAKDAVAVDIDPMAVETAYSNLALNNLPKDIYHGYAGDITTDKQLCQKLSERKYDIVLANIVADVIINLSGFVKNFMKDDGVFICSGIIIERKDEVRKVLEDAGLKIKEERVMNEWAAFTATKGL
ncbi:MAG: 50S ribosomal protein L11 methyltransferase [Clostridia bacterium]|nr:50S ribosomal protein L11 methyltransferase [Clostridia bacterium]